MAPRAAPALRVLPLALAAAIFSGLTAILVYLSGVSSSRNAPTPLPPSSRVSVCVSCWRSLMLELDGWVVGACRWRRSALGGGPGGARRAAGRLQQVRGTVLARLPPSRPITIRFVLLVLLLISCRIVIVNSGGTNSLEPRAVVDWESGCFRILDSVCQLF